MSHDQDTEHGVRPKPTLGMLMAVLGVVYGDIGTSPLYAFKASLQIFETTKPSVVEIMGVLSLIFWSLIVIVTLKYVFLVMRADNRGEGGILALMALAQRVSVGRTVKSAIALIGIAGACLFFGDGVITPAISVLSAVEGLEVSAPELKFYVLPISVAVIVARPSWNAPRRSCSRVAAAASMAVCASATLRSSAYVYSTPEKSREQVLHSDEFTSLSLLL